MKAPKLLKGESATSFKRRVKAWEQRTGQKYPRSRFGKSDEERILDGAITTTSRLDQKKDYSKDYDLDQVAKEEALSPSYYQEYIQSKEGKEFSESEAAIQEGIETDRREDLLLQISQEGVTLPEAAEKRQEEQQLENTGVLTDSQEVGQEVLLEKARKVQEARTDLLVTQGAVQQQQVLDRLGGQEYTTSFREAFRNANKTQVYADTMESGSPLEKSNVFSQAAMDWGQYKQGDTLGVMTRNQRRAYDEAVAAMKEQKLADEATGGSGVYGEKGKETLTEGTTDQEANEKGKVLATDPQKSTESVIKETSDILKDKKEIELP